MHHEFWDAQSSTQNNLQTHVVPGNIRTFLTASCAPCAGTLKHVLSHTQAVRILSTTPQVSAMLRRDMPSSKSKTLQMHGMLGDSNTYPVAACAVHRHTHTPRRTNRADSQYDVDSERFPGCPAADLSKGCDPNDPTMHMRHGILASENNRSIVTHWVLTYRQQRPPDLSLPWPYPLGILSRNMCHAPMQSHQLLAPPTKKPSNNVPSATHLQNVPRLLFVRTDATSN
jgi:hypothetical protein